MMRTFLILLALVLFVCNYEITDYLVPGDWEVVSNQWIATRYLIYDVMFLIMMISVLLNPNSVSRFIAIVTTVIVFFSVVDKSQGITVRLSHDMIVVAFGFFIALLAATGLLDKICKNLIR